MALYKICFGCKIEILQNPGPNTIHKIKLKNIVLWMQIVHYQILLFFYYSFF
jgi:hypothetical protein